MISAKFSTAFHDDAKASIAFHNAVLLAHITPAGSLFEKLEITIEVWFCGVGQLHIDDPRVATGKELSYPVLAQAMHIHAETTPVPARQAIEPSPHPKKVPEALDADAAVAVCYLKHKDSSRLQHAQEFGQIALHMFALHMLQDNAGVDEAKPVVGEGGQAIGFIQQEPAPVILLVKPRRLLHHGGRDVHSAAATKKTREC